MGEIVIFAAMAGPVRRDGSVVVAVRPSAQLPASLLEGSRFPSAGAHVRWDEDRAAGWVPSAPRWSSDARVLGVEVVLLDPVLRRLVEAMPWDLGVAFEFELQRERIAGAEVPLRVAGAELGVVVRGERRELVESARAVARSRIGGTQVGVVEDLEAGFRALGLSEAAAKHAAGGRGGTIVGLSDVSRPVPIAGQLVAKPAPSVPVVTTPATPVAGAVTGLGESKTVELVEQFRLLGLSEAAARHAAEGR